MSATCELLPIGEVMSSLGVQPGLLDDAQRRQLDERGYLLVPDLMDADLLRQLRCAYERLLATEGLHAGFDYQQEVGAIRMGNLVNKDPVFDRVWTHPTYLAAVHHIIPEDFVLNSLSSREPLAQHDGRQQGLHLDGGASNSAHELVDAVWMLDDFTARNGPTRLIPGSHRWSQAPWDVMDVQDDHPQQISVIGKAGSVLIFNGRLWHSGTLNRDGSRRRGLFPYMSARRTSDQGAYQRKHLLKSTWDRLAPAARQILGV